MKRNSQAKILRANQAPYSNEGFASTADVFNPNTSNSDIRLTSSYLGDSRYQQWDGHGKAVGYAVDPSIIHTPKPQVANGAFLPSTYPRDAEESGHLMGKHGRQESTDVVGWHQGNDQFTAPYAPDSFTHIPSLSKTQSFLPEQTPTQSNFVNGPPANNRHFDDVYGSTSSFHTATTSPRQYQEALPNPFTPPADQPGFQAPRSPPQPRSPPPPGYMTDLR